MVSNRNGGASFEHQKKGSAHFRKAYLIFHNTDGEKQRC